MDREGRRMRPMTGMAPAIPDRPSVYRARMRWRLCVAAGLLVLASANQAAAQMPVLVGQGGAVVVNPEVLDSLGPGPSAPAYGSPANQTRAYGTAPYNAPAAVPSAVAPGVPYPSPGSGPLVISRPGTLLFPPEQPPRSRLTVPLAPGQRESAPRVSGGKLPSRLLVEAPQHQGTSGPRAAKPAPVAKPKPPRVAQPEPVEPPAPEVAQTQPAPATPEEKPVAAVAAPTQSADLDPPKPPVKPRAAVPEDNRPAQAAPAAPAKPASTPDLPPPPPPAQADARETASETEPAPAPPVAAEALPKPDAATTAEAPVAEAPVAEAPAAPTTTEPVPQTAARTSGAGIAERRILFDDTSADLNDAAKAELTALADALKEDPTARVQLLAYAKDRGDGSSRARRVSLSRALSVRAFLIDQGIRSTRMDVRALGDKAEGGPTERVDILPQETRQ